VTQAYRLTERAEADVDAIADFIAADNIDAAVKVVLALEDAFVLLASRPGIGHARADLTDRPLKFWSVSSYLVVYDPASDPDHRRRAARRTRRRPDPEGDRLKLGSA
jgi:plasmid stabilization system protein ParE